MHNTLSIVRGKTFDLLPCCAHVNGHGGAKALAQTEFKIELECHGSGARDQSPANL